MRAGLVEDPKDYRYCGYAEAVAGRNEARAGLCRVLEVKSAKTAKTAKTALSEYRKILFLMGSTTTREGQQAMDREEVRKVVEADGKLPISQVLRLRVRYFSDGMVLGSKDYVNQVFEAHRSLFGKHRKSGTRPMLGLRDSGMMVMRDLRKGVFC